MTVDKIETKINRLPTKAKRLSSWLTMTQLVGKYRGQMNLADVDDIIFDTMQQAESQWRDEHDTIQRMRLTDLLQIFPESKQLAAMEIRNKIKAAKEQIDRLFVYRESTDDLRSKAYGGQADLLQYYVDGYDRDIELIQKRMRGLNYELQAIRQFGKPVDPGAHPSQRLTINDIEAAKQVPISFFYTQPTRFYGAGKVVGCCPFHSEKSGSFVIYTQQNSFSCFGCGAKGGDVISFVQQLNKIDFIAAVRLILNK